jgi:magnesium chelatase subunit D
MSEARPAAAVWADAISAAALLAVDPVGLGGVAVRAPAGEVREAWLKRIRVLLPAFPIQLPADVTAQQLLGGLDLERTLAAGRPILQTGALARADRGLLTMAMAERLSGSAAALVASAMDRGEVAAERDGFSEVKPARFAAILLDEGASPEERPPAALLDRLALHLDLTEISHRDIEDAPAQDIAIARAKLANVTTSDDAIEALCAACLALGIDSGRAPTLALRAARASAALAGRDAIAEEDIQLAARLVLGPRATQLPAHSEENPAPPEPESDDQPPPETQASGEVKALEDVTLDAALASIPPGLFAMLQENARRGARSNDSGKAGDSKTKGLRGRPIGSRRGDFRSRARLDLLDTLRSAAPWQNLRRRATGRETIEIRRDDIRLKRFKDRQASTTIFVVDASGSTAMDRLGEAKGAVEMLLSDCYVRRDEVALIAFRGQGADLLLPATRSLTRARKSLASLPGGGGTPLASGLAAAEKLAHDVRRKGRTPTIVIITDGRANVARDGIGGRERAHAEAETAASLIRHRKFKAILVDNAPRPEPKARAIADRMGAIYLPLPHVKAAMLSDAVRAHATGRPGVRP